MNVRTDRIEEELKKKHEVLTGNEQTASQEYYVLAVLKSLFPEEYAQLERKEEDRPDLRSVNDDFGVEVTTVDSSEDNQDNREFVKYVNDGNERRKETIKRHGKSVIDIGIPILQSSGGYNSEYQKQVLKDRINGKITSAKKYANNYKWIELALVKQELESAEWSENIFEYIDEAIDGNRLFKKIYVIYLDNCYCIYLDGKREKKKIMDRDRLKLLGYLSAKGIIRNDDVEWQ